MRLGRTRSLVLPLARAESALGVVLPRTGRATGLLERTMGARGSTSLHALRDGSRARDVGRRDAYVYHRARRRRYARTTHCRRARDYRCHWRLSGAARTGGLAWLCGRVRRRVLAFGEVEA
jgi:hypothetical protein